MKYTIYQAKNPTFRVDRKQRFYKRADYNEVYSREDSINDTHNDFAILEWLFETFNISRPMDFKGHSLSVGDIIGIENRLYVCASVGWVRIDWED